MRIQNNISAMNAHRILTMNNTKMSGTLEKLSSGYRVNRAADDAAGLGISEKMRAMIHGMTQAEKNCHDAISLVQTAEGALSEVHTMLQRMNEIAVQSANGSYDNAVDRASLQLEFEQLQDEIDHIAKHTDFNGMKLFDGTGGTYTLNDGNVVTNIVKQDAAVEQNNVTLESLLNQKSGKLENIIYTETVFDFETTQTPGDASETTNTTPAGWAEAAATLQTQIVPQAVQAILDKYSAFSYLTGSSIGIGLELYTANTSTLASVGVGIEAYQNTSTNEVFGKALTYKLKVNMNSVDLSTEDGRNALESTIAHEMIHAFMDEALTSGMLGITSTGQDASKKFPMWFIEGMAQTASGPGNWTYHGLGINNSSTAADIKNALNTYALSYSSGSGDTAHAAQYGTGYLACMYLGYLAAGSDANLNSSTAAAADIVSGLNTILGKIINGQSLDDVIKEVSNNKYSGTSDFQSKFANDTDAADFIYNMQQKGYFSTADSDGNIVSGGLISGDLLNADPYPNSNLSLNLFALDKNNTEIKNTYPDGVTVLSGGTVSTEGVKPMENMPETPNNKFGDFTVTGGTEGIDFEYDEGTGTLTVKTGTALKIEGTGSATTNKIKIADGITANVTIKNVNIDLSSEWFVAPILVDGTARLNLTLSGENTLVGGGNCAGLQVADNATLVIDGQGKLDSSNGNNLGAGIGGGHRGTGGTIIINGGTITATGTNSAGIGSGTDAGSAGSITINGGTITATGGGPAAGIGGGNGCSGGDINISGGTITATGGDWAAGIGGGGSGGNGGNIHISNGNITATGGKNAAGIGGGANGSGGTIEISGGTVTATGGSGAVAIGNGYNGSGGTFSTGTNGNADITVSNADNDNKIADLISDTSGIDVWNATINGKQYPLPPSTGSFTVTGGTYGTDYTYDESTGTLTVLTGTALTIEGTGNATTDKIKIADGITANVTIKNVNIDLSSEWFVAAILVDGTARLNLTLSGENTLVGGGNCAGLQVADNATLVIDGQGKLDSRNGLNVGAGIGGGHQGTGGTIIINDGTITATGTNSAGIGSGADATSTGSITINGGTITAQGSGYSAGIGGARQSSGGIINIAGGTITATGSGQAAGIGGGCYGSGGDIEISGGEVTAIGGGDGAGIGGGYNSSGGTIDINGGTVIATGGDYGAGIGGGGGGGANTGGTINIADGIVTATGGKGGAGIGGGNNASGGDVTISGGNVTATGGTATSGNSPEAIGAGGENGSGGTFSTTESGTAEITVNVKDADGNIISDPTIEQLISDTSDIDVWSAKINGTQYPLPLAGTGNIDLSTLTGDLEIVDGGYKIGNKNYAYSGDYTFTGTTDKNITVSDGGTTNITFNGATGNDFTVKGNSTVNLTVTGDNTMTNVAVEEGSKLNISGDGTLKVTGRLDNDGTVENSGTLDNDGEIDNDGTIKNQGTISSSGDITNNDGGTIDNSGEVINNDGGTIDNSGDIINNNGGTIANDGEVINNDGGTIDNSGDITNNDGGTIANDGDVTNNDGGTVSNSGDITNNDGGSISNDGDIHNSGTIDNSGEIDNDGVIDSLGDINNNNSGSINNDGEFYNNGTINNSGDITNNSGGTIISSDNVTNNNGGDITNKSGGTIINEAIITNNNGGTVTNSGEVINDGGTIDNSGEVTNNDDGTIANDGNITNNDGGTIANDGEVTNNDGGTVSNSGDITNNDGGTIDNSGDFINEISGSIDNSGDITNNDSGTIGNIGEVTNNDGGTIDNSGEFINERSGSIDNSGDITNNDSGTIASEGEVTNNDGGTIANSGEVVNGAQGTVTNNDGGTISNSGEVINGGGTIDNSGDVTNNDDGTIANYGNITNNDGGTVSNDGSITNDTGGTITNADGGVIDNNGDIDNDGTLTNNGEIKSRPDSTIDGTVGGNAPVDAPEKTPPAVPTPDPDTPNGGGTADEETEELFGEGENIWIMQTGARSKDTFTMDIGRMNTKILGIHKDDVNIGTQASANAAIDRIGEAVNRLSLQRADIGAYHNRIEHKIDNLNVSRENLTAAESKIRDTDMAGFLMEFTKNQILQNAAQAMLAQANALPQGVLNLIQ